MTTLPIDEIRIDKHFAARLPIDAAEQGRLQDDIGKHGILVPLLVTKDNLLLDGHRRFAAAKALGMEKVPVHIINRKAEENWERTLSILANLRRQHLNEAQRVALGTSLLRTEEPLAKERKLEGQKKGGKLGGKGHPKLGGHDSHKAISKESGLATARVAEQVGVSRKTFERVRDVLKKGPPELAKKLLAGDISVHGAAKKVEVAEIKKRVAAEPRDERGLIEKLSARAGVYRTIYADPPWEYQVRAHSGSAEQHYPTLSIDTLCEVGSGPMDGVATLAHPDGAHLWLWTTWPMIREGRAKRLVEAWGFRWVGEIVWKKDRTGTGFWLMPMTEILILAVSGNLKLQVEPFAAFREIPRGRHSEKPEEFRQIIEETSYSPRIELFARKATEGWDRWGLEA